MTDKIRLKFVEENGKVRLVRSNVISDSAIKISTEDYNNLLNVLNIIIKVCNPESLSDESRLVRFYESSIKKLSSSNNMELKDLIYDIKMLYSEVSLCCLPELCYESLTEFSTIVEVIEEPQPTKTGGDGGVGSTWG